MKIFIRVTIIAAAVGALAVTLAILLYNGIIQMNNPSRHKYPVRGVDVSHYQGEIKWDILAKQGIDFAYIKATEGSSHEDSKFVKNWEEASKTNLRIGAYHFFSFESNGDTQADNFIRNVRAVDNMMPPVADVEPYGLFAADTEIGKDVLDNLSLWMSIIEAHYGVKPVIYTTKDYYRQIHDVLPDYDIWIRDVYAKPNSDIEWKFWQYSCKMKLDGYKGEEKFIDMNTFLGTKEEFEKYGK